jgi:hypothetical protein
VKSPWATPNDPRLEGRLPPCLPHETIDCPICLAEAEAIVDEFLAAGPDAAEEPRG